VRENHKINASEGVEAELHIFLSLYTAGSERSASWTKSFELAIRAPDDP
jgi:hypothetical protein